MTTSWATGAVMTRFPLWPAVTPLAVAWSTYVPAALNEKPAKVATPPTVVTVVLVHESVPGPESTDSVTGVGARLVTV